MGSVIVSATILLVLTIMFGTPASAASPSFRIHVLPYDFSDAIILESNGEFAMIDCGEDTDYPNGSDSHYPRREGITTGEGYEKQTLAYLEQIGATPENFKFVIGTHPHSDHIGAADEVIRAYRPQWVYTPLYQDSFITDPAALWDNQYVYDRMLNAATEVGAHLITTIDPAGVSMPTQGSTASPYLNLGDMTFEIFNYDPSYRDTGIDDANRFCYGVKVTGGDTTAFIASDIDDQDGVEDALDPGPVDILKVGHHGLEDSSCRTFLDRLSPSVLIQTSTLHSLNSSLGNYLGTTGAKLYNTQLFRKQGLDAIVIDFETLQANGDPYQASGWYRLENGNWSYVDPATHRRTTGWFTVGDQLYYGSDEGELYSGWHEIDDDWYYFNRASDSGPVGQAYRGWKEIDGLWYYFDDNGALYQGWLYDGANRYYFGRPDHMGAMATGWQEIDSVPYYFDDHGQPVTGWVEKGNQWYYLSGGTNAGSPVTGWVQIDGDWYYFNGDGTMHTGWLSEGDQWFYFSTDQTNRGVLVHGDVTINGSTEHFNSVGAWAQP